MEKYRHISIMFTISVDIPRIHTLFHGLRENTPSLQVVHISMKEWPSWLFVRDILQFCMEELPKCFVPFLLGLLRKKSAPIMDIEGVVILCMTNIDRPRNVITISQCNGVLLVDVVFHDIHFAIMLHYSRLCSIITWNLVFMSKRYLSIYVMTFKFVGMQVWSM